MPSCFVEDLSFPDKMTSADEDDGIVDCLSEARDGVVVMRELSVLG